MPLANCLEPVFDALPGIIKLGVPAVGVLGLGGGLGLAYYASEAKKFTQDKIVPGVLNIFAENEYDEALLRTYRDKANGYVRQLVFTLMYSSLACLWFLNFTNSAMPQILLAISMFFTGSFHYRYKKSMDSDEDFPKLGRVFYRFYPFINEDSAFSRKNKMEKNSELEHKAERIIEVRKSDFIWSLGKLLVTGFSFLTFVAAVGVKAAVLGDVAIIALMAATYDNWWKANVTTVFSDLQCYLSMLVLRRPMHSVDAPPFGAGMASFEAMSSNLKVAHYHHSMRCFPPYSQVLQAQVYDKMRKDGKTIGQSMALVSAAQWLTHVVLLTTFQAGNKNLVSTLIPLTIFYAMQGGFKVIEQDGMVAAFKDRDYRRNAKTKKVVFLIYKIFFFFIEFALYCKPMALLFLDGYEMNSWTLKAV